MAAAVVEQSTTDSGTGAKDMLESEEVIEDQTVADPEADSAHYMAILVECLNLLGKIPDAVKVCVIVFDKVLWQVNSAWKILCDLVLCYNLGYIGTK